MLPVHTIVIYIPFNTRITFRPVNIIIIMKVSASDSRVSEHGYFSFPVASNLFDFSLVIVMDMFYEKQMHQKWTFCVCHIPLLSETLIDKNL